MDTTLGSKKSQVVLTFSYFSLPQIFYGCYHYGCMNINSLLRHLISWLFYGLFVVVPLAFTSVNDELFEFNKMLVVYAIAILMAACWSSLCILEKKFLWKKTPFDLPIAIFVGSQILSTVFSINIHTSLFGYYSRFNGGLFSVLSYVFLFYMFVLFVEKKHLRPHIVALLTGGVLSALYALPEHFGHSPSCLLFTGQFDVTCWVQDVKTRVFGTFGQPNWLAAYLGMLLPLAIVNTKTVTTKIDLLEEQSADKWISSMVRILVMGLFCVVLLFTGSRSGMIAMGTGFVLLVGVYVAFLYLSHKHHPGTQYAKIVERYLLILAVTLSVFALSISLFPNPIREKIVGLIPTQTIQESSSTAPVPITGTQLENGGSESGAIRAVVWRGAFRVWQRYPIFGSGVETFAYSYYGDRLKEHNLLSEWDFLYNKAHNEFLNYLSTTGIVGLASYLLMLGYFILYPLYIASAPFFRQDKKKEPSEVRIHESFLLVSLSSGIAIVTISNFFGFSTVMVSALLFLYAAFITILSQSSTVSVQSNKQPTTSSQYLALAIVFIFLFLPLLGVRQMWVADTKYATAKQLANVGQYINSMQYIKQAVELQPDEPTFHDEYSSTLASLAVLFAKQADATRASEFAVEAIKESDTTLLQNGVHLNFWKTRVRIFLTLAQLDPQFYRKAHEALLRAHELSPTDPKLVYYLALISQAQDDNEKYKLYLLQAIDLKPNYEEARTALAKMYESENQPQKALEQYQYMIQFINPNNTVARERIASLSATKK